MRSLDSPVLTRELPAANACRKRHVRYPGYQSRGWVRGLRYTIERARGVRARPTVHSGACTGEKDKWVCTRGVHAELGAAHEIYGTQLSARGVSAYVTLHANMVLTFNQALLAWEALLIKRASRAAQLL